jgi:hypothetical protein
MKIYERKSPAPCWQRGAERSRRREARIKAARARADQGARGNIERLGDQDEKPPAAPVKTWPPQQPERFVRDSFGNLTGTDGTRIIKTDRDVIVIPPAPRWPAK